MQGGDEGVGHRQAWVSNCFISARAYHNSLVTTRHAAAVTKPAKKFNIFHQRHLGKSANINKCTSPTEHSAIAASHSEQQACIMRALACYPIHVVFRAA